MIEALIGIGGIIGVAAVGLSVTGRMTKWWSSALYALIAASLAVLMVTGFYAVDVESSVAALWYARLGAVSVVVALTCLYFLIQELVDASHIGPTERAVNRGVVYAAGILTVLLFTPFVFPSAYATTVGGVFVDASWGAALLIAFLATVLVLSGYYLFHQTAGVFHRKYGVLDIRFVAVRTVSYIASLAVAALIFMFVVLVLARVFADEQPDTGVLLGPISVVAALSAALAFQPIRKFFNRHLDHLLYKENYSISEFSMHVSQTLNSTNDLRTLLGRTSRLIATTLKTSQAFFFVHLMEDRYMIAGTDRHSRVTPSEFDDVEAAARARGSVLISQFDKTHPLHRMMVSHRIGLIVPLYKKDAVIGYLCLGRSKRAGYTSRDLRALRSISDELTIAIQNALSVDEVRKLNDTLEQRIDAATKELRTSNAQLQRLDEAKDEFISMASHQLRTPLTSIKGYISMMLEGDVGKVSKEQAYMLNEAFVSSERMVRLIGDFLNVSRLQTGKFVIDKRPVDLARLVDREIDGLAQNAAARDMKFVYKKPKGIPKLELDENKIQQVVMNFADNAIYYSKEKSKITVSLKQVGGYVEFRVVDTGIGVPAVDQQHLFNKFFRASNARRARPDGTGVGLFLAKKVIDDHDGQIIFESKEGKGSTFGFRLPLPRE